MLFTARLDSGRLGCDEDFWRGDIFWGGIGQNWVFLFRISSWGVIVWTEEGDE